MRSRRGKGRAVFFFFCVKTKSVRKTCFWLFFEFFFHAQKIAFTHTFFTFFTHTFLLSRARFFDFQNFHGRFFSFTHTFLLFIFFTGSFFLFTGTFFDFFHTSIFFFTQEKKTEFPPPWRWVCVVPWGQWVCSGSTLPIAIQSEEEQSLKSCFL